MNDERLSRELDEIIAMLKQAEHAAITSGQLYVLKDIAAIHIAALYGHYEKDGETE